MRFARCACALAVLSGASMGFAQAAPTGPAASAGTGRGDGAAEDPVSGAEAGAEGTPAPPPVGAAAAEDGAEDVGSQSTTTRPAAPTADAAPPARKPAAEEAPAQRPTLAPPRLVHSPAPEYPAEALDDGRPTSVVLHVVVDASGAVRTAHVDHPAGEPFDSAALRAIGVWRFAPATRDGAPIAASVHVAVHFRLPDFDSPVGAPSDEPPAGGTVIGAVEAAESTAAHAPDPEFGATAEVEADALRAERRGGADFEIGRDVLEAAPRQEGADVLRSAPGLYIARGEGEAVGHRLMLRGFDADHGQDLAVSVGGIPVNLPSHIHGQGYADLGFLIAPAVGGVRVKEGVYDPSQGDFAVAGSIDIDLSSKRRGVWLQGGMGAFGSFRHTALWAPVDQPDETLSAVSLRGSDGFGERRFSRSASALSQVGARAGAWRFRGLLIAHGARADLPGVLRRDDIDGGAVGFYDSYPVATARAQNASNARLLTGAFAEHRGGDGDSTDLALWLSLDDFSVRRNFTGFTQESRRLAAVGRGDLVDQGNVTTSVGLRARHRSAWSAPSEWLRTRVEVGTDVRTDLIHQTQRLIEAQRNQVWDERVDADVRGTDVGLFGDLEGEAFERLVLRAGVRADALFYRVDDRLQNAIPLSRRDDSFIEGYGRSAAGIAWGPRASADYQALPWLNLLAAYGEGYRSPQARTLDEGERAPFTKVRSADFGLRTDFGEWLSGSVSGFWTELSDDVAFEAAEGTLERVGGTRRVGATAYLRSRPLPWLLAAASATYVDAELLEPPPPTEQDPSPPFEVGQNLPYVPPLVLRLDLGVKHTLAPASEHAVAMRGGLGASFLSARPLPFGAYSAPVGLFDASLSAGWRRFTLGLEVFNVLDRQYAAVEHNFVSQWGDGPTTLLPARHIAAGPPRTWMVTLGVQL